MKYILILMVLLIGIAGCVSLNNTNTNSLYIPYTALQDIPNDHFVGSGFIGCPNGMIISVALHDPKTGYWMLWMNAKAWIMASYGLDEPKPGELASVAIAGRWEETAEKSIFKPIKLLTVSQDHSINITTFCNWLVPFET